MPWQGFVGGFGLGLFIVKDRHWLWALLLTTHLPVSWQAQRFPAQGVHQAERRTQDLHGMCSEEVEIWAFCSSSLKVEVLLSEEAAHSSLVGEKQEQELSRQGSS